MATTAGARPSVAEFFAGRSVLITGATGFVGKALLEKLLLECPDVDKVYLIVRPKKGVPSQDRVKEIVDCPLFKLLRTDKPGQLAKIAIAPGDLMLPGLGLEVAVADEIRAAVSVVLHCAATVNFNEKLKVALQLNVLSVQQLLAFARSFRTLAAFVHVSTAFSNCDRLCIQETVYDPVADPKALMAAVFSMDDATAERITPGLVGQRPNTYTFTKSLAEVIVREDGKGLPVAIMRPSIIGAALKGSLPGWQDNLNGPGGLYIAAAHGVLRVMKGDPWAICDIVPVDYCANIILAIAWHLGTTPRDQLPAELPVFHCTCGSTNQMSWGTHFDVCFDVLRARPLAPERQPLFKASFKFQMNPVLLALSTFAQHTFPAMVVDAGLALSGQKPMMGRLYGKLNGAIQAYEFFTSHSWWWEYNNAPELASLLSPSDRERFSFDMTKIDWFNYICDYWGYTQTFIKPDPPEKVAKDAQRARTIKLVVAAVLVAVVALLVFVALNPTLPVGGQDVGENGAVAANGTYVVSRTLADLLAALVSW